ncbi:MFS transporter [Alicyclobacillus ferrooxydans]|nr:MFS transporter [Alicyclobacillus ferrooxydans]
MKNRNFVILFSGQLVSTVGDNLYGIALLWYVLQLTHSKSALTITGFAMSLPPILGIFVGVFVDRWRKHATLVVSDVIRAILLFALFSMSYFMTPNFAWIVSIVVLVEVVGTFFGPAYGALIPHILRSDDLAAASGLNMSGSAFASLGGMLGGGALMGLLGASKLFLGDAVSFVLSVVSLLFVRSPEPKRDRKASTSLLAEWKEGLTVIKKSRYLLQTGLTSTVNNFSLAGFGIVIVPWVKNVMHGSAFVLGSLEAALLIGMILGGLVAGAVAKRFRYRLIDCITLTSLGAGVSLTGAWANVYWDIAVMFAAGLMLGIVDGAGGAVRVMMVPEEVRGRVFSTLGTMSRMATPIGVAVLGTLMIYVHLWIVLLLTGIGPIIGGLSFLLPFSKQAFAVVDDERFGSEGVTA